MKILVALAPALFLAQAFATEAPAPASAAAEATNAHRYLIERTFPAGALAGLDAASKAKVNANNASVGVHWVKSYANADETKTFCVYEGPSEAAVRQAATLNALPIDSVTEVPVAVDSGAAAGAKSAAASHRYLVERTFASGSADKTDAAHKAKVNAVNARFGVRWVTSYDNAAKTRSYGLYEGPTEAAVRDAAGANGMSVDRISEVPVTLLPN